MSGRSRSPLSAGERSQLDSGNIVPTPVSSSPSSPFSRTRHRGFSLRKSILARNAQGQSEQDRPSDLSIAPLPSRRRSLSTTTDIKGSSNNSILATISPVAQKEAPSKLPGYSGKNTPVTPSLPRYENWARRRAAHGPFRTHVRLLYKGAHDILLRIHTICSSRYTLWNFLPRQLFAQFSKLANFYFLCVSVLQMIPGLSTTGNYTTIVPLTFFVMISMAKEAYDDFRRYKLDKAENSKDAYVAQTSLTRNGESCATASPHLDWVKTKWRDVRVGDVVKLQRDEAAPADMALLHVDGVNRIAYFETMALDGETNLKSKQASTSLAKKCESVDELLVCNARLTAEDPNLDLYNFDGKTEIDKDTLPITNSEIVYRGSILRNTSKAIGMVVYSGEECKIRMNATKNPRIKAPALQFIVNRVVVVIVTFVIALAIFNTVAYQIWVKTTEKKAWYLTDARVAFFPILTSFIIYFYPPL